MNELPSSMSEPTPDARTVADAASPARLRPAQAPPAQRDPREEGCIDEHLGWVGASGDVVELHFGTGRTVMLTSCSCQTCGTTGSCCY
jgi:hypothetical protein